jgi:glucose-6-phosphate isomerase
MRVDIGNALAATATPGVPREALERLDERVAAAHKRIDRGRETAEHGYTALSLPARVDPDEVLTTTAEFDPEAVLVVGIGGSALGATTLAAALPAPDDAPPVHALDNVDPTHVERVLDDLPLAETVVNVVSKSGTTAETLANFLVVRERMRREGIDWTDRTLVTTGETGPLRRMADRHDLPTLQVPDGVPGRFSVLSAVGTASAALRGADVEALVAGARDAADDLSGSLFETPGYAYGSVAYALDRRGATGNAMMPYAEALEPFAEWFAQLWAESLGKEGLGQTPLRALGATDQHSQLQLYRAGPRDKLVTFVRPTERLGDLPVPEELPEDLVYLAGEGLGDLLDAEFRATEASLAAAGRPSVRVELDHLDARSVGELLYGMEAACVLVGELEGVETFTQPAVEWGKTAARGLLGGAGEAEREAAAAVAEKERLVVD